MNQYDNIVFNLAHTFPNINAIHTVFDGSHRKMFPVWDLFAYYGIILSFLTTVWFMRHIWKYLRSFMCPKRFNFLKTGEWAGKN